MIRDGKGWKIAREGSEKKEKREKRQRDEKRKLKSRRSTRKTCTRSLTPKHPRISGSLSLSLYFNDRCLHISYKISSFNYNLILPLINIHFNFSKIFKLIYNKIFPKKRISGRKLFKLFHFPDPLDILSLVPFLFHFVFSFLALHCTPC